jgi:hypothetical protein
LSELISSPVAPRPPAADLNEIVKTCRENTTQLVNSPVQAIWVLDVKGLIRYEGIRIVQLEKVANLPLGRESGASPVCASK